MSNKITLSHSKAIVVLGMHRSGTSALTRVLNILGVHLGSGLMPKHLTNELGFWEHFKIVKANEQILQRLDSSWLDSTALPEQWWHFKTLAPLRQYLSEVLRQEFSNSSLWGIKDPRLCRLLPLWIPLLEKVNSTPHFVIIVRHPLEVIASLEARDGLSYNTSLRLWLEYVLTSVQTTHGYPRVFVTYDELLKNWSATATKIAQAFKIEWPNSVDSVAGEIDAFLSPSLKHQRFSPNDWQEKVPGLSQDLLVWSDKVYQIICHTAEEGEGKQLEVLNAIQTALVGKNTKLKLCTPGIQRFSFVHILIHLQKKQLKHLKTTLEALRSQDYSHWYLSIVADFNCADIALWDLPNVRWLLIDSNRQAMATINREIAVINAEWVALITAGDSFAPDLFSLCVQQIESHPSWRFIYVDEENDSMPNFKPDFNLDLLRATPYMGNFCLIKQEAQQTVGGYTPHSSLENYDIALKIFERYGETAFGHIAKVLYHRLDDNVQCTKTTSIDVQKNNLSIKPARFWKPGRFCEVIYLKNYITTSIAKWIKQSVSTSPATEILQQHLQRQNIIAKVQPTKFRDIYWIDYALKHNSLVSIIIGTRNGRQSLQRCLNSLLKITAYSYYEIIIVDNHSDDVETLTYLETLKASPNIRFLSCDTEITPAEINNLAAKNANGGYLLFLNDDTEIIEAEWLQRLLALNQRQEIGIVAPRLLDNNQHLIHAGFILGMGSVGIAGQINQGLTVNELGYQKRAQATQNFSAVSDSCLMIKQSVYETVEQMDEKTCNTLFSEVDLCLKVRKADYKIVWTPHVTLLQHGTGSLIRNRQQVIDNKKISQEVAAMFERGLSQFSNDPAYNPNLCLNGKEWQSETQINVPWIITQNRQDSANQDLPINPVKPITHDSLPKIVAFPHDSWGVGEYRARTPLRALQQAGLAEYAFMPNDDVGRIPTLPEFERMQADTLLFHNALHDEHLNALQQLRRFSHCFKVFGQDDLIYALPKTNPYYKTNYKDIKQRVHRAITFSDRLIVTTEPLVDAYRFLNTDIRLIPNYIEYARWKDLSPQRQQGRKPRIGWAGAAQHQGDLRLIMSLVKALAQEVEWVFFGLCPKELKEYIHECYGMVPFEQYPAKLASLNLDLAIAPLEQNTFNEAKSNLRLLEYGILGYPVVCSDIYPYQNAPVTRVANTEHAWLEAVRARIDDLENTAKEGDNLKKWVINNWLLEDHLTQWGEALNIMNFTPHKKDVLIQSGLDNSQKLNNDVLIQSGLDNSQKLSQVKNENNNLDSKTRWIFILGCEQSGTNLLAKILCQHESIAPIEMSAAPLEKIVTVPALWTEKETVIRAKTSEIFKTSEVDSENYTHLIVEGLPANMGKALLLQAQFPNAYFILIVRDSYAVSLALRDHVQQTHGTMPLLLHRAARQWQRSLAMLQEDAPKLQHFLEIQYEDVLDNPKNTLEKVFNFLSLIPINNVEALKKQLSLQNIARQNTTCLGQISAEQRSVIKNCQNSDFNN
ncbi:sulfotransferase [Candidatus Parabeggiatoa sp. HSG14]|uniref:sulfotransferase n=1 Tax=Candidatus Parabeggiatoa sp. HSG14 TaxID=3055593 RepID=UPI0025A90CFF|nr:sulfotransferase [Thiotrichales bacterium HSG14]